MSISDAEKRNGTMELSYKEIKSDQKSQII